jgi:hypothetical protein
MNLNFLVPAPSTSIFVTDFCLLSYSVSFISYCIYAHFLLHHCLPTLFILILFFDMLFGFSFYMSFSSLSHSSSCLTAFHERHAYSSFLRQAQHSPAANKDVPPRARCRSAQWAWTWCVRQNGRISVATFFLLLLFHLPEATARPVLVASQKHRHCGTAGPFFFFFFLSFLLRVLVTLPLRRVLLRSSRFQACLPVPEIQSIMAWY